MASTTPKLGLHKIDLTDAPPDITVLNDNWDKLDEVLGNTSSDVPVENLTGVLPIAKGGTGATDASSARTNLGAAPAYTYGTSDLTAGTSSLETGKMYLVYE